MTTHLFPERAASVLAGLLIGAALGLFLTQTVAAFLTFVLHRTLDVDGTPVLLALFIAVPVLGGIAGGVIGYRRGDDATPGRRGGRR
ncbi:hypothetical protein E0L36_21290 [Streptomyces sp. AJS327]|uniref:hypothetical protein n=1 Tax=Streptomyces sp. AJS327 TaxID=2545265 RepID=UPI0015DE9F8F|nr:hypothetical protein [Streptomyces sp. AJS327]MBA0053315.1 hypothetical protein [Streptomyces sp. AJS327]